MTTTTNVPQVKLNIMTQQQYNSATKVPTELYMITDAESGGQIIQVTTLPTASVDELNNIYQYVGTTGTYTNGYFYKCVSDGAASPTYSWTRVDVQPSGGGSSLPSQTGHSGEFLKTDGTDPSWAPALVNQGTGTYSIAIGDGVVASSNYSLAIGRKATASGAGSVAIGTPDLYSSWNGPVASGESAIAIGSGSGRSSSSSAQATGYQSIAIGAMTIANKLDSIAFGTNTRSNGVASIAIGCEVTASADYSIQLGTSNTSYASTSNSDANTFKVANSNGNFEIMSADGTVPADRLVKSINKYSTMPTATSSNEGWIVQYTGTTDATYTHGYIYECVSDGASTPTYS